MTNTGIITFVLFYSTINFFYFLSEVTEPFQTWCEGIWAWWILFDFIVYVLEEFYSNFYYITSLSSVACYI